MFDGIGILNNCLKIVFQYYLIILFWRFRIYYIFILLFEHYIYPPCRSHRTSSLYRSDQHLLKIFDLFCSIWLMEKALIKEVKWNSDLSFIFERCWQSAATCIWRSAISSHGRSKSWVLLLNSSFYHKKWTGKFFH